MDGLNPASPPTTEPASGKSTNRLRDAIRAGMTSVQQQNSGDPASSAATDDLATAETGQGEAPARAEPDAGNTAPENPDAGDQAAPSQTPSSQDQPDDQASQESPGVLARWPEERRQAFEALPDEAKNLILEREREINKWITQNGQATAESRKKLDAINSQFQDHHRHFMQHYGVDEAGMTGWLLQQHDAYTRDPVGFGLAVATNGGQGDPTPYIAELIKRTGVTQDQLFGGQQPQGQQEADPQGEDWDDPLEKRIDGIEQMLRSDKESREKQQQMQAQQAFLNEIRTESTAVNEDGSPKYPHMQTVVNEASQLLQLHPEFLTNPRKAVKESYEKAVRVHPELSKQLQEEEVSKRLAAYQQKQEAERARRASAATPSPGSTGQTVNRGKMSLRDAVHATNVKSLLSQ